MTVRIRIENTNSTDQSEAEVRVLRAGHLIESHKLRRGESFDGYVYSGQDVTVCANHYAVSQIRKEKALDAAVDG